MRSIYFILIILAVATNTCAQFDSSGYRYLFSVDNENSNVQKKYADSNLHVLSNTKKKTQGLIIETYSLIHNIRYTTHYLYDKTYSQNFIATIGIEQFSLNGGRLAILSNKGVFYSESPKHKLKLLTSELTAFEFNDIEFSDSVLYLFRHSTKMRNDINFEVFTLIIDTKEVRKIASDTDINAIIYSNFQDSRLVAFHKNNIYRADYVLPVIYKYKSNGEKDAMELDSQYIRGVVQYCMPDSIVAFLNSCSNSNEDETMFIDTTIKLRFNYYLSHRQLIVNNKTESIFLFASFPDTITKHTQFVLCELSIAESELKFKRLHSLEKKPYDEERVTQVSQKVF